MTAEDVLATTPAWQQTIDRLILPLTVALVIVIVLITIRRRKGSGIALTADEARHSGWLVFGGLGALALVWLIGAQVGNGRAGFPIDHALADWARHHLGLSALHLQAWISEAGSTGWLTLVTIGIGLWQWRRGNGMTGLALVVASAANGLAIRGLKAQFERIRPEHLHAVAFEPGFSYPSGHSAGATLVYGLIAWLIARELPADRRWLVYLGAALLVVLIASSRVLLQVHYFSDVIGGILLGLGLLLLTIAWVRSLDPKAAGATVVPAH